MSVFKLNFPASPKTTRRKIIECSDQDFVIVPDFLPIEVVRRKVAKYEPTEILRDGEPLNNIVNCHYRKFDKISIGGIEKIERKAANKRYAFAESFYLITKPEGIDLYSFAAWVNSLKPL